MPGSAPRATLDNPYGPAVTFRTEDVLPPSALYISMNDTVVALFACFAGAGTYNMTTRILLPDGTIQVEAYVSQGSPNPSVPWIILPPVEGYLLSLVVTATATIDGSQWCQVGVFRGTVASPLISLPPNSGMLIVQGYVDQQSWLSWPNSPVVEGGTGAGRIRAIRPALTTGAEWSLTTTSYQRFEIISIQGELLTSPAAGTRQVSVLLYDNHGVGICRFPVNFTQAPALTVNYYWYNSAAHLQPAPAWVTAPIPTGLTVDVDMSIQSRTVNLDVSDQWALVVLNVKEWIGVSHA